MDPAASLGAALTPQAATAAPTVSGQVVDLTTSGRVNLTIDNGMVLLTEVACPDSYRGRKVGDWVAVRLSAVPVVLWRLGEDPGDVDADTAREIALDAQTVAAATWGTTAPAGTGWQAVSALFLRKNVNGQVEMYGQLASASDTSPTQPGRTPRPVTLSPTDSGAWRGGRPDTSHSVPMQGDWTGRGDLRGGWFYGTSIASACAGKTVASMTVRFSRRSGAGVNAKRPLHLYLHAHTSAPSGQLTLGDGPDELLSLSIGATGTATLPASWRSQLASGAARGLAIYAHGASDYMAVTGGQITITFS